MRHGLHRAAEPRHQPSSHHACRPIPVPPCQAAICTAHSATYLGFFSECPPAALKPAYFIHGANPVSPTGAEIQIQVHSLVLLSNPSTTHRCFEKLKKTAFKEKFISVPKLLKAMSSFFFHFNSYFLFLKTLYTTFFKGLCFIYLHGRATG